MRCPSPRDELLQVRERGLGRSCAEHLDGFREDGGLPLVELGVRGQDPHEGHRGLDGELVGLGRSATFGQRLRSRHVDEGAPLLGQPSGHGVPADGTDEDADRRMPEPTPPRVPFEWVHARFQGGTLLPGRGQPIRYERVAASVEGRVAAPRAVRSAGPAATTRPSPSPGGSFSPRPVFTMGWRACGARSSGRCAGGAGQPAS
jgi:hypothetical protein